MNTESKLEEILRIINAATPPPWDEFNGMIRAVNTDPPSVIWDNYGNVSIQTSKFPIADFRVWDGETLISRNHENNVEFVLTAREYMEKIIKDLSILIEAFQQICEICEELDRFDCFKCPFAKPHGTLRSIEKYYG